MHIFTVFYEHRGADLHYGFPYTLNDLYAY